MGIIKLYAHDRSAVIQPNDWLSENWMSIDPKRSQDLFNHSPDGFSWGYGGSGPAQLALAILLELTENKEFALRYYQEFKRDLISGLPLNKDTEISLDKVCLWINQKIIKERENVKN